MIASARASTRSACVRGVARSSGSERAAAPRANAAPVARSFSSIGNGALPKSTTINPDIRPVVAASPRRQERSVACSAAAAGASRMFSCLVCPRGTIETARLSPRGGGERDEIVQFLARREKREKGKKLTLKPLSTSTKQKLSPDASSSPSSPDFAKTALLGALFAAWYAFNIWFNIFNKQVLQVFPYSLSCTTLQFAVGSALASLMWLFKLHPAPKVDKALIKAVLPLAAVHTLGNLLTNVSLGAVAVSFTHTIKAMEPFFSVLLSALFLGEAPTLAVVGSLLPIVGGVALASASEATFNWFGFLAAMGSNVTFQSRNVFSKKFMGQAKGALVSSFFGFFF